MNMTNYEVWEARQTTHAQELAQRCLELYNSGHYKYSFSTNQTKSVMEYVLMKVYHIVWGSSPSLGFFSTIRKQDDLTRVCLRLFNQAELDEADSPEPNTIQE
jgi:hypothetical protein